MRRKICAAVLVSLFFLTACSRHPEPSTTDKVAVTVAHWGHEKILIYLPLYVAIDAGLFDQQGLGVNIKYSGNDDQVFATVISGDAQFGVGDPTFTAISREKGGPGKVVATLVGAVANWGVTNKKSIGTIHDPHELDGLRVTSFPSPSTTYTILSEIKSTLNLRRMQIVQLAFGTEIGALERGDADLAIMLEPQTSIAVSRDYREVWSVADYYGPFTLTGLTTSDDEIAKHPEVVQKMVNGLQQALVYIRSHPAETAEIASRNFSNLDKAVVRDAVERMVRDKTIPVDAQISPDAWRKTLEIRHKVGDLKSIEAGLAAVDNSFAERALHAAPLTSRELVRPATPGMATIQTSPPSQGPPGRASGACPELLGEGSTGEWTWRGWLAFVADVVALLGLLVTSALAVIGWYNLYYRFRRFPEEDESWVNAIRRLSEESEKQIDSLTFRRVDNILRAAGSGWGEQDTENLLTLLQSRGIVRWNRHSQKIQFQYFFWPLLKPKIKEFWRQLQWRHNIPSEAPEAGGMGR